MQMNKAILRNSEIVIFDKKNNFTAARLSFFFPTHWIRNRFFFSHRPKSITFLIIFKSGERAGIFNIWALCFLMAFKGVFEFWCGQPSIKKAFSLNSHFSGILVQKNYLQYQTFLQLSLPQNIAHTVLHQP